jgi:hypothetical protein
LRRSNQQVAPEPEAVIQAAKQAKSRRQEALEKRADRGRPQPSKPIIQPRNEGSDNEFDDDDLVASTSFLGISGSGREARGDGQMPTIFCHVGGASHRFTRFVQSTMASSSGLLPRLMRRKPLGEQ